MGLRLRDHTRTFNFGVRARSASRRTQAPDDDETESDDEGTYTIFKEVIEVEEYKTSYIETL